MTQHTVGLWFVVALVFSTVLAFAGCKSSGNDQGDLVTFEGVDGPIVVRHPGREMLATGASLEVKAVAEKGRELLSGKAEAKRTFERIQKENPNLRVHDVLQFHLATVYASGGINKREYGILSTELFHSTVRKEEGTSSSAVPAAARNCWDDHPEGLKNIIWVLDGDADALERYRDARGDGNDGKSVFDSLLEAQDHNENAQRTIRDMGRSCVEAYVKHKFGDR